ncbi:hypothetical protein PV416_35030 [Streptomyces ipomoeae]|uniref:hypothetical protein n=1 Tax=Streptomyces ipomoeae TaxID=103232 RepID=UPI0029AEA790|nr:hypothetical protein [Streptomyces ipomoeae]MDX2826142.1 hypothetical protein [Streptomyces ipomoeae]MDX2881178.1 hypothetical protein [Streptomyces ipomoeae]
MSTEINHLVGQASPYLTAAVIAYGSGVLTREESAAVEATADIGHRMLRAAWHHRDEQGRAALESAVADAAAEPEDDDAAGALRQQIKKALREDAELRRELTSLLPTPTGDAGGTTVTASGPRSIAAGGNIGVAITGDGHTAPRSS